VPRQPEYVWLIEENVRAELVQLGAFASVVRFTKLGTVFEVAVNSDEFYFIGEEGNDDED
jgi:hypothetical protein